MTERERMVADVASHTLTPGCAPCGAKDTFSHPTRGHGYKPEPDGCVLIPVQLNKWADGGPQDYVVYNAEGVVIYTLMDKENST